MMTNHLGDLLSAYIDNELGESDRHRVEEHLSSCEQCQLLFEDLLELQLQVSNAYQTIEAPHDMEFQILERINRKSLTPTVAAGWFAVPVAGLICLTAILLLIGPFLSNLFSIMLKFLMVFIYVLSSMVTSAPSLLLGTVLFSVIIVIISSFSLRRLLTTTSN
jgi:predicted anti-sigma-YlaC factor YlaD